MMNAVSSKDRCMYEKVMQINKQGVRYLHSGNIREALLSFQNGMSMAQPLLAQERRQRFSMAPRIPNVSSVRHESLSDNMQQNLEVMHINCHLRNRNLKRGRNSWNDDLAELRCTPSRQSLMGLNDGNYYVYDRPLVFQNVMKDDDHIYNINSALLCIIVISFNFALACHYSGKAFGQSQRYLAATELYYMVLSVSRECCLFSELWDEDQFQWHANLQFVILNNLVHVHDELNEFSESNLCMTSLRECILAHMDPVYGCLLGSQGLPRWNADVFSSFVSPDEFEKFKLNLLYFHKPNTARAA